MFILTLLLGCPGTPEGCQVSDDPMVSLGVGETEYGAFADGDEVDLVYGTQGGYHMPLAFDGEGLAVEELVVADLLGTIDGEEVARGQPWLTFRCNPETGTQQVWNVPLIFDEGWLPVDLHLKTLVVTGTLRDDDNGDLRTVDIGGEMTIFDPRER
ncbi:MAG: hypothetical protein EP330_02445 [Deltaproteobacteria bacterium]|nr:MAG: hypothetical protein EP330_02445 [Deltaproteobacteria bacterium]